MAEFAKVAAEMTRMCRCYAGFCKECPLGFAASCKNWVLAQSAEAEQIIMKWAAENPLKTNGDKFREVFGYDLTEKFFTSSKVKDWYNAEYKKPEEQEEEQEELT